MHLLDTSAYARVIGLFESVNYHLSAVALLRGAIGGRVLVDDEQNPHAALLIAGHRYLLAGDPGTAEFHRDLLGYFKETIFPHEAAAGEEGFLLYFADGWERAIEEKIFAKHKVGKHPRQYYEFRSRMALAADWRAMMPEGFELAEVNRALLERSEIKGLDALREEMCSERPTVEDFLANSFGYSLLHQKALITWCLSEYNTDDRCEVGIATAEGYRKRGLATLSGAAFVERALAEGYNRIGWHCWAQNMGSVNTALKIGFEKVKDYSCYYVPFGEE